MRSTIQKEIEMLKKVLAPNIKRDIAILNGSGEYLWTYNKEPLVFNSEKALLNAATKAGYALTIVYMNFV